MSKLGHHNYAKRASVTDAIVRASLLRRSDEQFQADLGDEPISKERAYELGTEGGVVGFVRRHTGKWGVYPKWVTPAGRLAVRLKCLICKDFPLPHFHHPRLSGHFSAP